MDLGEIPRPVMKEAALSRAKSIFRRNRFAIAFLGPILLSAMVLTGCAVAPQAEPIKVEPTKITVVTPAPSPTPLATPTALLEVATPQPDIPQVTPVPVEPIKKEVVDTSSLELTQADVDFLAAHEIARGDSSKKVIALTFDAGASSAPWPKIRETFKKYNIKTTVFLTADFIKKNPAYVREMISMGMEIGNHSTTHPDFTTLSSDQIRVEITTFQSELDKAAGFHVPVRFFRFPYGARNTNVLKTVAQMGLQSVYWSAGGDSGGWKEGATQASVENNLTGSVKPGQIDVQHIGSPQDADALEQIIKGVQAQGYTIATVSQVMSLKDDPPSIVAAKANGLKGPFAFKLVPSTQENQSLERKTYSVSR
ncbi:hypothetical protein FJY90_03605 [Candidatus Gottesmanbacteria bacterium]|nr:hypothetical protein [Candidatus Gottesmanbacteria bacterium]